MSIDMSQFYQVFFEETQEHLANMESLLLELDVAAPDSEQLNAVFRAAHSIKGSSGTFGFTDLADVTHILENLLDRIRKGELGLRDEMIDAFLDAGDVLKDLLAAHRGEGAADPVQVKAICERLTRLTDGAGVSPSSVAVAANPVAVAPALTSGKPELDVRFVLDMSEEEAATTVANFMAEIAGSAKGHIVGQPSAADPAWHVVIAGDVDEDYIRGLLEFVARSDSIRIGPATAGDEDAYGFFDEAPSVASGAAPEADPGYGFFDDEPPSIVPVAEAAGDPGYGFFDEPPAVVSPAVEVAPSAGSEGDGYGFFVDIPAPVPVAEPAPLPSAPAAPSAVIDSVAKESRRAGNKAAVAETSIRVGVDKVDQLINLVGELVITQAMLAQSAVAIDPVAFERLHNGLAQLERNTRDLQESVMSIRMMPISVVFSRFPRVVRDLSQKLGKQVELKMSGESTELDKGLLERITDPLTHLIRNSLDHGVEMPDERAAKGKQSTGTITLKAYHQSGNIVIEVGDDGAGLNRQKILGKARERGLAVNDAMTDQEVWQLIFEAGFSTADQITEVSGRGVGMDVVKRNISAMGGRVEIESMTGVGTRMTVRLPLTLAILDGMSVAVGRDTYIIPLGYVIESLQVERSMIKSVSGVERLIQVRGEYLPVIALFELFNIPGAATRLDTGIMVVLEADGVKAALFVDALVGQHQVVIKSLEANYRRVAGISGATIMGDGHVALILDVVALVQMARTTTPGLSLVA